tara:strand:+ start:432 stop:632 length:201 start_codon:yes stop_codon:yes gene_type:complete
MGIANPELLYWFMKEYPKHSKRKLNIGKSCVRFKKMDEITFELVGELMGKMTPKDWIKKYKSTFLK